MTDNTHITSTTPEAVHLEQGFLAWPTITFPMPEVHDETELGHTCRYAFELRLSEPVFKTKQDAQFHDLRFFLHHTGVVLVFERGNIHPTTTISSAETDRYNTIKLVKTAGTLLDTDPSLVDCAHIMGDMLLEPTCEVVEPSDPGFGKPVTLLDAAKYLPANKRNTGIWCTCILNAVIRCGPTSQNQDTG